MNIWRIPDRQHIAAAKYLLRAMVCLPGMLITSIAAKDGPQPAALSLADRVADGRPWKMNIVESDRTMEMALFPDGSGVTDSMFALAPRWRATADGLCLKPSFAMSERCVTLVVRPNGYDGIENGKLYFELRR